jgi:hypothetical protein
MSAAGHAFTPQENARMEFDRHPAVRATIWGPPCAENRPGRPASLA